MDVAVSAARGDLSRLLRLWRDIASRPSMDWPPCSTLCTLARFVLEAGAPFAAIEITQRGLSEAPSEIELSLVHALALRRAGAAEAANRHLVDAWSRRAADARIDASLRHEVLGVIASTHKAIADGAPEGGLERGERLRAALVGYRQAYDESGAISHGVNAAAVLVLLGEFENAREVATSVARTAAVRTDDPRLPPQSRDRYWRSAVLAECLLIQGRWQEAAAEYQSAAAIATLHRRFGDMHATRRQAVALARALGAPQEVFRQCLPEPLVVALDGADYDAAKIFDEAEQADHGQALIPSLRSWIEANSPAAAVIGLCAAQSLAACESFQSMGVATIVVLPCPHGHFCRHLAQNGRGDWAARVDSCIALAASVVEASPKVTAPGTSDFRFANQIVGGTALCRAFDMGGRAIRLRIHESRRWLDADHNGTTARNPPSPLVEVTLTKPFSACDSSTPAPATPAPRATAPLSSDELQSVVTLLFADFRGFSALQEEQIPEFVGLILGGTAELLDACIRRGDAVLASNTWGDGLFLVFADPGAAANFALDLCEWLESQRPRFIASGLPADLSVRVALHSGPALRVVDPVTGRVNYVGAHVSHAARLEPSTPPNLVYASQTFASLLAMRVPEDIECHFVGVLEWAKGSGLFPTYRVVRAA